MCTTHGLVGDRRYLPSPSGSILILEELQEQLLDPNTVAEVFDIAVDIAVVLLLSCVACCGVVVVAIAV